jgi:CheY-like chemotaxis protein/HPt (histidine-containing phosphotransfer) domain-containing protein
VTLRFAVSDTGIGIPADKRQQIFQAFTQADSSTTRRYGGTGLGLAIAQRLVELMEGRIWLDSEVGRGTTFHFTATFGRAPVSARVTAGDRPPALEGLRVLVVDDNSTNRRIMQDMLASWHMKPVTVADAGKALTELRSAWPTDARYHVVISDCQMPDVDGFMLARRIRQDDHVRATPIVMLTSVGRSDDVTRCHRIGVDAYLTKPVKHSDLLDALATLFGVSSRTPRAHPRRLTRDTAARPLRVLVAEDNPVNRKLVTTLLQKRGHHVRGVEDGRAAVRAITAETHDGFDVALMDVQMPEMSGFEATEEIRAREAGTGHHLPIIALTAHAMQGDKDRCLAAGMDGYLAKPIDVDELVATVEHFASQMPIARTDEAPAGLEPAPVFDEGIALAYAGGDRRLLRQVIKLFRADVPGTLRNLTAAIERRDAEALRHSAHALRGAMAAIGATAGQQIATTLEEMGLSAQFEGAQEAYATLAKQVEDLNAAVEAAGLVATPAVRSRNRTKRSRQASPKPRRRS